MKTALSNRRLLIGVVSLVVLVSAVLFLYNFFPPKNYDKQTTVLSPTTVNEDPALFSTGGTISKVDLEKKIEASAEATLVVDADNTKSYSIPVNKDTKVNKYSVATVNSSMKLVTDKENWKSLKVGERVYIYSFVNLNVVDPLQIKDIQALDWYQTEAPRWDWG